jgi:tetratricopeptide (TPR) repeat protein
VILNNRTEPVAPRQGSLRARRWILAVALVGGIAMDGAPVPAQQKGLEPTARAYYLYSLAQQERFQRNYLDAIDHLKRAISYDPTSAVLHLELSRLYWQLREREQALEVGEKAARLDPENVEAHRFLATAYTALVNRGQGTGEELQRAISHHEQALELDDSPQTTEDLLPLAQLYQYAGRHEDSVRVLEDYLEAADPSPDALLWLAQGYAEVGRLDEASGKLLDALTLSPGSPQLLEVLGDVEQRRGNLNGAIDALRALVQVAPGNLPLYARLGGLLRGVGAPEAAIEIYEQAEAAARQRGDADSGAVMQEIYLDWSEALVSAGRPEQAAERIEMGLREFPDDLRFVLARGQLQYRRGETAAARQTLDGILAAHPRNARLQAAVSEIYLRLGAGEERAGEIDKAVALLERAIEVDPDNHSALNYLGYLWADRGENLERSVELIQRALQLDGDSAAYLDSLGWAYYRQGRLDLAEAELVKAIELDGDEPVILDHLGDLYRSLGRDAEAAEMWRRSLEAGVPDPEAVRRKLQELQGGEDIPR